ncbi:MAG TPA: nucleotidyltransferase domain-containing protein [Polyangiales bacterium]|nr:nucleotidyltransferase domain-containing protein [Polyangiales bacterium]
MAPRESHLEVAERVAGMSGVTGVVLGGSRASSRARPDSDWDLGVYYRGSLDLSALRELGTVHPPGSWGRIMNGGAWLSIDGVKVDVLLRDLDFIESVTARAEQHGTFDIDQLLGYVAGAPTYMLMGECALALPLVGNAPPQPEYPRKLSELAPVRWRICARFSLDYAYQHARRGDALGTLAQGATAALDEAHARMCERRQWVMNEKGLIERAGLQDVQARLTGLPRTAAGLTRWVGELSDVLGLATA